ncbi:uncharacterized protein TM35_000171880 [Trypanosoma theileri]|uniref:Uncharacterized protein n=1 Tax=Trypanosoma theileri TaxID=67003 RepID=A0A1X0NUD2_9TRYP|nr:uncharacterized protein TM35_000171880 [Trypanosoma theileri]ORC88316.1 hypothetical protein TM35_000171880 [Trypanosoma theileri]
MGLLLDDDEDCTHPLKMTRVEPTVPNTNAAHTTTTTTTIPTNTTITTTATTPNSNSNNNILRGNQTTAPLEVRRRGGNGIEKMAAFAFGATNTVVKIANTPPSQQQKQQQEEENSAVNTKCTKSLESFSPSQKQNTEPSTVAKTVFCSSQTFSEITETTPSTQNTSRQTELTIPLSLGSINSSQGSSAVPSANSVSRQLFNEGVHTKSQASTLSTSSSSRTSNETVPKPRGQMKLSDFFTKMACTKKRE